MSHHQTVRLVRDTLCLIFAQTNEWFDRSEELRRYKPEFGGWSIDQVLEHVSLTNRFLMLTLGKWVGIARQRASRGDLVPGGESDLERLYVIGERGSFGWERPEHMEPTGVPTSAEVQEMLHRQLGECLIRLEQISGGLGAMCLVTMTVNDLGKIDLYQWLFFIAQHARRHLQQMVDIEAEYRSKQQILAE